MQRKARSPGLAKLSRPRLARVHPRERLFQRLDESLEQPAVWVSGLAGAGKTTLIASYLAARKLRALWYHVDSGDTDPAACCYYLQLAVSRLAPQACADLPVFPATSTADEGAFLRHFFLALYACTKSFRVLVIDNSQDALSAAAFRKFLRAAIREAPEGSRVIIASRTRPGSDFARLRANGNLAVVDADELLLSEEESLAVQRLTMPANRTRSTEQMRKLHQLTGGWLVGLKLLLQLDDPDALAVASGRVTRNSALFDYLAAEVFERQPASTRSFLLKLAHLPRMTPAMAAVLGDSPEAAEILASMHSDNTFTLAHEVNDELHYEFHPLLREFLQLRARSELSGEERDRAMHQAATLLERNGDIEAAARVLIAGRHWPELQRLIVEHAQKLVDRGWQRTLSAWLDTFPEAMVADDPWLTVIARRAATPYDETSRRGMLARPTLEAPGVALDRGN